MKTTQTGIVISPCRTCGIPHPVTRKHCDICGSPSLFPHDMHARPTSQRGIA